MEFKAPLPPAHEKLNQIPGLEEYGNQRGMGQAERPHDDQGTTGNLIQISMDDFDGALGQPSRSSKNANRKGSKQNKIIDLKKLDG